jgi:hypothetical protein
LEAEPAYYRVLSATPAETGGFTLNHQTNTNADSRRILDLEIENARLRELVAELLIKNQELRQKRQTVEKPSGVLRDRRSWVAGEV